MRRVAAAGIAETSTLLRRSSKNPRHLLIRLQARSWQADDATMSAMPGRDPVKPADPGVKLTYDDFVLFPDDGKRHELIDGEHYVTPSPNMSHQTVSGNLYLLIASWLEIHPIGRIWYAPLDVVFSQFDVVEPDLLYMSNER